MKRAFLALVLVMPLGCKEQQKAAAADPAFDQEWASLEQGGAEPLFIEGELHGAGLMGEVRRAVSPSSEGPVGRTPAFNGPLPDAEVVKVIRQNLPAVKSCYQVEERAGTIGSGKAIVSLDIDGASGAVTSVRIDAPAFQASRLPACVSARAKAWTFPKFTATKHFSYPFVFVGG
jgi:hypothetical protein